METSHSWQLHIVADTCRWGAIGTGLLPDPSLTFPGCRLAAGPDPNLTSGVGGRDGRFRPLWQRCHKGRERPLAVGIDTSAAWHKADGR